MKGREWLANGFASFFINCANYQVGAPCLPMHEAVRARQNDTMIWIIGSPEASSNRSTCIRCLDT